MGNVFSRVMYCENCAKQGNPKHGQKFVIHGRSKKSAYYIRQVSSPHKSGYTPHLIEVISTHAGIVHFSKICGIADCGVKVYEDDGGYKVGFINQQEDHMEVKDWNALVMFKGDTGYQLDD